MSHTIRELNADRNRMTRGARDEFSSHRRYVTRHILQCAKQSNPESLCILGVGNGNDLDFEKIMGRYSSICLVDFDPEAIQFCLASIPKSERHRFSVLDDIDLTGIVAALEQSQTDGLVKEAMVAWESLKLGTFDVVVSTCVLSQLLDSVTTTLGENHPEALAVMLAIRDSHLCLLDKMTLPGGSTVLITDFVSSDTLQEIVGVSDDLLPDIIARSVSDGNFFTGLNPGILVRKTSPIAAARGAAIEVSKPWRWDMGPRAYAVFAITIYKDFP